MAHGDWKQMFLGIQNNDLEMVKYYIDEGVDVNYQHPEYMTSPLIESIVNNYPEMVKLLLDNGASVNVKEAYTELTPLQIAKSLNYIEIQILLKEQLKTYVKKDILYYFKMIIKVK
jgi:ankyrin repeat protein